MDPDMKGMKDLSLEGTKQKEVYPTVGAYDIVKLTKQIQKERVHLTFVGHLALEGKRQVTT